MNDVEPDWDAPLTLTLTPTAIFTVLFASADEVHTAWQSCVDSTLVVGENMARDEGSANYCRLVEQEYEEDGSVGPWHDWCVELRLGDAYLSGHWRVPADARGADWAWSSREAQQAFRQGCLLVGRRVVPGLVLEEVLPPLGPSGAGPTRH